jgi:superfamily II DNA/RNA helicase
MITTPGRLLYHLKNTDSLNLANLQHIVIDEADRMLDMGFEREMEDCLSEIKRKVPYKFSNIEG